MIERSRKGVWEEIYIYWVPEWGQKLKFRVKEKWEEGDRGE